MSIMISGYTNLASWPRSHLGVYHNYLRHLALPKVRAVVKSKSLACFTYV